MQVMPAVAAIQPKSKEQKLAEIRAVKAGLIRDLGVLAYKPHDKQKEFHALRNRTVVWFAGNRGGKTTGGGAQSAQLMLGTHPVFSPKSEYCPSGNGRVPVPNHGWVVSLDFAGVRDITWPELLRWLPRDSIKEIRMADRIIILKNGSTAGFKSTDSGREKFQGTSRNWIWIDEEPPEDIWTECKMRIMDCDGIMYLTMTPVDGMTWVYDGLYQQKNNPKLDIGVIVSSVFDNPYLNKSVVEEIGQGLTEQEKQIRFYGRFVQLAGLIYPTYDEHAHIIDDFPIDFEAGINVVAVDAHISKATAVVWMHINRDGDHYVYRTMKISGQGREIAQNIRIKTGLGEKIKYSLYDPSTPGFKDAQNIYGTNLTEQFYKEGVILQPGIKDVDNGIRMIRELLGDPNDKMGTSPVRLKIFKSCADDGNKANKSINWEFQHYRHVKDKSVQNIYREAIYKVDDDFMDCLRLIANSNPAAIRKRRGKSSKRRILDSVTGY